MRHLTATRKEDHGGWHKRWLRQGTWLCYDNVDRPAWRKGGRSSISVSLPECVNRLTTGSDAHSILRGRQHASKKEPEEMNDNPTFLIRRSLTGVGDTCRQCAQQRRRRPLLSNPRHGGKKFLETKPKTSAKAASRCASPTEKTLRQTGHGRTRLKLYAFKVYINTIIEK